MNKSILILLAVLFIQCNKSDLSNSNQEQTPDPSQSEISDCNSPVISDNKVYTSNGETFLWGGNHDGWDFNITDWLLDKCQLNFGLGREYFPALIQPEYVSIQDIEINLNENEKCIVLRTSDDVKVFPYAIMLHHEVVNDVVDGSPVMIAYCVLADLAAVYSRNYCNSTLTFATSGYTYHDENVWGDLDAFVLWDRETESLWWPLIDKAVSGVFKSVELDKHDESKWEEMIWKNVKSIHPNAKVLKPNQDFEPPISWPSLPKGSIDC